MTPTRTRPLKQIDPETARGLIATSESNEPLDEKWIRATAIQMKKGRFDPYGACLELNAKGHLFSGLQYLYAIVESNCTVKIWVAENRA